MAVEASSLKNEWVHMLLYGKNRIGKTTLACHFPKPLLLISMETTATGGSSSIASIPGVKVLRLGKGKDCQLKCSEDVEALGYQLQSNPGNFQSVVMDSGTALDEILLAEICGWDEPATMIAVGHTRPGAKVTSDQYTERSERMRCRIRPYLDLNRHVVIVCNEKDHNPQENRKSSLVRGPHTESFMAAAMGGGTTRWVQDGSDYICQLYMDKEVRIVKNKQMGTVVEVEEETGRVVRRLRMQYHPNYAGGGRADLIADLPEYIQADDSDRRKQPAEMIHKFFQAIGMGGKAPPYIPTKSK